MPTLTTSFGTQAGIARAGSGSATWTNPTTGAKTNENTFSVNSIGVPVNTDFYGDWLVVSAPSGLGAIGDADTVTGVTVNAYRLALFNTASIRATTSLIHYSKVATSAPNGTGKASATVWPLTETLEAFGGAGDIWGHGSISGAEIKAAGSSVWISARQQTDLLDYPEPSIDFIEMTVEYTVAPSSSGKFLPLRGCSFDNPVARMRELLERPRYGDVVSAVRRAQAA